MDEYEVSKSDQLRVWTFYNNESCDYEVYVSFGHHDKVSFILACLLQQKEDTGYYDGGVITKEVMSYLTEGSIEYRYFIFEETDDGASIVNYDASRSDDGAVPVTMYYDKDWL